MHFTRFLHCLMVPVLLGFASAAFAVNVVSYLPHAAGSQWSFINNNLATMTNTTGSPVTLPSGVIAFPWTGSYSNQPSVTTYNTIDASGFRRHQEYMSSVYINGYGNTSATAVYAPALLFVPADVTVGSTYTSNGAVTITYTNVTTVSLNYSSTTQVVGFETVSNNAGTQSWSAIKVIASITLSGTVNGQFVTQTSASTFWMVDGLGIVQIYKPNASGVMETWKLTSTNVTPPPAIPPTGGKMLNLAPSWNLVGNSVNAPLTVATTFGNAANVSTVWKWIPATSKWAFYTPLEADGGAAYAATKGYDFLTTINAGEGFWVNAKAAFTATLPAGTEVTTARFQDALTPPNPLPAGWSLISVGGNPTPVTFNNGIGLTPPATGTIAPNLTTLWAWDSASANWYFYAPSLDANGTLATYITGKNYLNFGAKPLDPAMGFWVNRPASATGAANAAEGFWVGTSSTGYDIGLAILENGETWGLYSSGNVIYGALVGNTATSGNSLSGTGTDYNIPARTATQGSYSGTVTSKSSIAVTTSSGSGFNGTYRSLYDQSPSLTSLAGTYLGYGVSGSSTTQYLPVTISSSGIVSAGSQALGCIAAGSVTPRASGKNIYNLSVTFTGVNCALGNGTSTTGIAVLDTSVTPSRLYAMALKSDKSDGFIWTGTR